MNIEWVKCEDRMPDGNGSTVIFNPIADTSMLFKVEVNDGSFVKIMGNHPMRWTEYTLEKWEYLNK